jgi:hypothetical protein
MLKMSRWPNVGAILPCWRDSAGLLPRDQGPQAQGQGSFLQHGVRGGRRRHFSLSSGDDAMMLILNSIQGSEFIRADCQNGH